MVAEGRSVLDSSRGAVTVLPQHFLLLSLLPLLLFLWSHLSFSFIRTLTPDTRSQPGEEMTAARPTTTKTTQTQIQTRTHPLPSDRLAVIHTAMTLEEFYVASSPPLSPPGVEEVVASLRELSPVSSQINHRFPSTFPNTVARRYLPTSLRSSTIQKSLGSVFL